MTDPQLPAPRPPRVYGDEEIGRILKRATELQQREPKALTTGVTLAELEEIAAEAGIDPLYLRRAARELEAGASHPTVWSRLAGGDITLVRETTLDGELGEGGFEWIVSAIHSASTEQGQPSLLGRTLTWRAETAGKSRTLQIVVTSRDGQTHIRAEENLSQTAGGIFGGVVGGGGTGLGLGVGLPVGLGVLGSVTFSILAPLGSMGLAYLTAREIYRAVVRRRGRALDRLFGQVVAEAERVVRDDTEHPGILAADRTPGLSSDTGDGPS